MLCIPQRCDRMNSSYHILTPTAKLLASDTCIVKLSNVLDTTTLFQLFLGALGSLCVFWACTWLIGRVPPTKCMPTMHNPRIMAAWTRSGVRFAIR